MNLASVVGRSNELEILASCLDRAGQGGRDAVLILGGPGYGKTWLATYLAEDARNRGFMVAWCSLRVPSTETPYELWTRILEDLLVALERDPRCESPAALVFGDGAPALVRLGSHLFPQQESTGATSNVRFGLAHDLLKAIARVAAWKPLLLVFDNLQFADETSLAVFQDLCVSARLQPNLVICATARDRFNTTRSALSEAVTSMITNLGAHQLRLHAFSRRDVEMFLRECGATPTAELVDTVHQLTGGNPFFVSQVSAISSAGCRDLADIVDPSFSISIEERILEYFQVRLNELNESTRMLLSVAGVLGGEFGVTELSIAAGNLLNEAALRGAVETAIVHSFLDEIRCDHSTTVLYRFNHEFVRRAILRSAEPVLLRNAHHRMARFLQATDVSVHKPGNDELALGKRRARIGEHLLMTDIPELIRDGIGYLLRAADSFIAVGAWEDAEVLLSRLASERAGALYPEEQAQIEHGLGRILLFDGRKGDAYSRLRSAVEYHLSRGDLERAVEVALQPTTHEIGHTAYIDILQRVLAALPETHPEKPRVQAYYAAALALTVGEYERAREILENTAAHGETMRARAFLGYLNIRCSMIPEARALMDEAFQSVADYPDSLTELIAIRMRYELARMDGATACAREAILHRRPAEEAIGDRFLFAESALLLGRLALGSGDWSQARDYFHDSLRRHPDCVLTLANLVTLECLTGHNSEAHDVLSRLVERAENTTPGPYQIFTAAAGALTTMAVFAAQDDDDRVAAHFQDAHRMLGRSAGGEREHPFITVRRLVLGALIAYYGKHDGDAEQLVTELGHVKHYNTIDQSHIDRARGLLWYRLGRYKHGETSLLRAISTFQKRGNVVYAALSESELAAELAATDPVGASRRRADVLKLCDRLGISGLADRMNRTVATSTGATGGESLQQDLTAREREVVGLLVAGLSDKEIAATLNISVHTASNHVRHILRKTGCGNRTQVVAWLGAPFGGGRVSKARRS